MYIHSLYTFYKPFPLGNSAELFEVFWIDVQLCTSSIPWIDREGWDWGPSCTQRSHALRYLGRCASGFKNDWPIAVPIILCIQYFWRNFEIFKGHMWISWRSTHKADVPISLLIYSLPKLDCNTNACLDNSETPYSTFIYYKYISIQV